MVVLARDAFRAPRFPSHEALKLAPVAGRDFDKQVNNQVCESKGDDVGLWDSPTRHRAGKLKPVSGDCMLGTLHRAALKEDPTFLTALEAIPSVLPPSRTSPKKTRV